jgi:two-component system sensor histidine kinase UhpB
LIELFAYAKVCYLWVEAHSEISYQDDPRVQENLGPLLHEEPRLADFFRAHSEQVETEYRLREDVAERQQKEVEIRSLLNISNKLNSTLDIDELMDSLILEAMKLTDAELGWSGLRTKKGVVCHKYVRNSQFIPFEYCWPPGVGWPGWVLLHGVPYLTNDAASDNVIVPEIREQFGVKSGIDTPLLNIHSEVIGFFEVNNKKRGPFTESDVEKLTAVAQAASVALQNALVYRQLQDAQQALSESEDRYRRLVQLSPEPVGVHCDGKIAFINPAGAKLFGAAHPDELIGKPIMDLVHPDYRNIIQERLKGLAAGKPGPLLEQKGVTLDGRVIDVEAVATPITYQGKSAVQFLCRDITERKRTERSLRESDERFRSFMNYMTGYAWIKNVAGSYVYMNERLLKILPKHQDDWLGRTDSDFWPPEVAAEYKRNDQRVLRDKRDLQVIETWPREGQTRYGLVSKFPIFDAHGDAIMVGGTSIDITETKQIEEKLKTSRAQLRALAARLQSVREEEKMVLAREIHDELGQVLTALKMDLAYANRKLGGEGASIQEIHKKMHSMIQVIDDTVEKVRRIATDLRPDVLDNLGLVPALEWYAEEFQSRTGITCKTKLSTKRIVLDQTRATAIFRIFQETLTNVARHSGASLVEVNLRLLRDRLLLEIQDNGKGINGTDTRERNSLGILGMQERSLLLGGTFKITGIPGEGTTVSVMIPLSGKYR